MLNIDSACAGEQKMKLLKVREIQFVEILNVMKKNYWKIMKLILHI